MSDEGHNPAQTVRRTQRLKMFGLGAWAVLATAAVLVLLLHTPTPQNQPPHNHQPDPLPAKRNVIFMVSDGMGPASVALARNYFQHTLHGAKDRNDGSRAGHVSDLSTIALDSLFVGNSRTQSSDSYVTDSAAGATAFACGLKSYNGAIGVDSDGQSCATVLEAAKLRGMKTGLVVTTRITDATPACFASHAHERSEEDWIAEQLVNYEDAHPLGQVVDLLFGGGRCHFLPSGARGSCRRDSRDLIAHAQQAGWTYTADMEEVVGTTPQLPALGLFADYDLPFSIDAPSRLNETALAAVRALEAATRDSEHGFFLLVEGSRIDHAGHANDPAAQVREVLAYSDAVDAMARYAADADVPTIVVSTSDHETGGLSVSRQLTPSYPAYLWKPEVLMQAQHSAEYLQRVLRDFSLEAGRKTAEVEAFVRSEVLGPGGLDLEFTDNDVNEVIFHRFSAQDTLAQLLSRHAQVGWATHGHSGVDVNVYGASNHAELLDPIRGDNENTGLGKYMREFLGIEETEVEEITEVLRKAQAQGRGVTEALS